MPDWDSVNEKDFKPNWRERAVEPKMLTLYASTRRTVNAKEQKEETILRTARSLAIELLFKRILELIEIYGTRHQKEVFSLWIGRADEKRTYQNVGKILKANYSCGYSAYTAISHAIKGIKSKKHNKHHGGIENKLKKKCAKDEVCQELIKDLQNISRNVEAAIDFLAKHDSWYKDFTLSDY